MYLLANSPVSLRLCQLVVLFYLSYRRGELTGFQQFHRYRAQQRYRDCLELVCFPKTKVEGVGMSQKAQPSRDTTPPDGQRTYASSIPNQNFNWVAKLQHIAPTTPKITAAQGLTKPAKEES